MQQQTDDTTGAVSEVVGEMLMIGLVLILVAVFSASLADYLPAERSPSVTICVSNDTLGNITLWHKGGDWVKAEDLRVLIRDNNSVIAPVTIYTVDEDPQFILVPDAQAFDLGCNITVSRDRPLSGNESVSLATDRAVLFSGSVGRRGP